MARPARHSGWFLVCVASLKSQAEMTSATLSNRLSIYLYQEGAWLLLQQIS